MSDGSGLVSLFLGHEVSWRTSRCQSRASFLFASRMTLAVSCWIFFLKGVI